MPALLGSRKTSTRRFRTPIERDGDPVRRRQLVTRIGPFIVRRTKAAVATELPPKHTILRRITLGPEQRELYETIRATLHEQVTQEIAAKGLGRSHVVVLDALLKLRQVCCDPRLVKLQSARLGGRSSKLDDLLEMVSEMILEGRRILLFSQFTSMLDLMKPTLKAAGITFVELRGDTNDRAAPVRSFEVGEVPLFLISLKAGGRGLNLTSADSDPLRPMVESSGRGSSLRPRPSHRTDEIRVRLQADSRRHGGGTHPRAAGAQSHAGEHRVE
jgi:SNF2 family DNA or RNA helicase